MWFDPAAFSTVTQARNSFAGTAGRGIVNGPGLKKVDPGIYSDFRVMEGKTLTFRLEMTNALNLVSLSNPGVGPNTSATFGCVSTANAMRLIQMGPRLKF